MTRKTLEKRQRPSQCPREVSPNGRDSLTEIDPESAGLVRGLAKFHVSFHKSFHGALHDARKAGENALKLQTRTGLRPALVRDLILAYSIWGDIVLDPFAGTGTTLEQAFVNQRFYLGMEKVRDYYQMCRRRLFEAEEEAMRRLASM